MVLAQLVKWSLPTEEFRDSNQVIGKFNTIVPTINCIEKTKINKNEAGNGPI